MTNGVSPTTGPEAVTGFSTVLQPVRAVTSLVVAMLYKLCQVLCAVATFQAFRYDVQDYVQDLEEKFRDTSSYDFWKDLHRFGLRRTYAIDEISLKVRSIFPSQTANQLREFLERFEKLYSEDQRNQVVGFAHQGVVAPILGELAGEGLFFVPDDHEKGCTLEYCFYPDRVEAYIIAHVVSMEDFIARNFANATPLNKVVTLDLATRTQTTRNVILPS